MLVRPSVGIAELAAAAGIAPAALRYHCRDPRGMLHGVAFREGRTWRIPVAAADEFRIKYVRFASLHKKEAGHTPCDRRPLTVDPRERKDESE
jgi:AcrR family transcriptional regulator